MRITQGWPNAQDLNLGDGRGRLIGSERENTGASAQSQYIQFTGGFSALVVVGVCTLVLFSSYHFLAKWLYYSRQRFQAPREFSSSQRIFT